MGLLAILDAARTPTISSRPRHSAAIFTTSKRRQPASLPDRSNIPRSKIGERPLVERRAIGRADDDPVDGRGAAGLGLRADPRDGVAVTDHADPQRDRAVEATVAHPRIAAADSISRTIDGARCV